MHLTRNQRVLLLFKRDRAQDAPEQPATLLFLATDTDDSARAESAQEGIETHDDIQQPGAGAAPGD